MLRSHAAPLTRNELRSRLRVNNQRLGDALQMLVADKRVRRESGGWTAAPPSCSSD